MKDATRRLLEATRLYTTCQALVMTAVDQILGREARDMPKAERTQIIAAIGNSMGPVSKKAMEHVGVLILEKGLSTEEIETLATFLESPIYQKYLDVSIAGQSALQEAVNAEIARPQFAEQILNALWPIIDPTGIMPTELRNGLLASVHASLAIPSSGPSQPADAADFDKTN